MMLDGMKLEAYEAVVKDMPMRRCYEFMQILTELKDVKDVPEAFVAIKRRIRKLNKELCDYLEESRTIKCYEDGSVITREVLRANTMEEAEDEFRNEHYIQYWDRGYDCTGQAFTEWHRIFKICDKYVLYHSIGVDC